MKVCRAFLFPIGGQTARFRSRIRPSLRALHKSRLAIIASAILLCGLAGCENSQADIVGKWQMGEEASAMVWEFSKDSSILVGSTRGKYTFGRNRVKIQTPGGTTVYQMDLSEDHMTLTAPGGSKLEFTRSK
jgi:hypothetical protein